ncbi:DUF3443 family protein [Trinickia acidisoli]|uniref:DUF3443 family protein n=1 Tax=Trinickia acidisoli TaxID=2767482 RepID=UPI001A906F52|nr:DUF3443 family protein [Trinickia acidisoli]
MLHIYKKLARVLGTFGLAAIVGLVAGCGGGGGGSGSSSSGGSTNGSTSNSGGGSTSIVATGPVSSTPATLASNQAAVVVSSVTGTPNLPMVSVTICQHGTSTCETIDNVQLDTGSYGLRLVKDTMLTALPTETVGGQSVAECASFADGFSWGSVRTADVQIGGETASNIPIQILGDVPQSEAGGSNNSCATGTLNDTLSQLHANGILGIGTAKYDCGTNCTSAPNDVYYGCTSSCTDLALSAVTQEVGNPVRFFATDNNGVVLNMPVVSSSGATSASGVLNFGIGTETNNTVPSSGIQTVTTDHFGDVSSASLNGSTYSDSSSFERAAFFDTGSNGLFFPDTSITLCAGGGGFYCPASAVSLQPSVTGFNTTTASISMSVQNAFDLVDGGGYAFNNLGGTADGLLAIDFGMPFFYGRTVYINYDPNTDGSLGTGTTAYVAF